MVYPGIVKGTKGPTWIVAPISKGGISRAIFNACARVLHDSGPISTEELEAVYEFQASEERTIMEALRTVGPIDDSKTSDLQKVEDAVYSALTED